MSSKSVHDEQCSVQRERLTPHLAPVTDQRDTEREHHSTNPHLSTEGTVRTVLDGDDTPDGKDSRQDHDEYCPSRLHIGTNGSRSVNRSLVTRQIELSVPLRYRQYSKPAVTRNL